MTSIARSGSNSGADSFGYDQAGNAATRTVDGVHTEFTFNAENQFAKAVVHAGSGVQETRHLYDAAGALLIRREPGATTLYAAGQEFKAANGGVSCTRYYTHGGAAVSVRTAVGVSLLAADHQGSANIAVNASTGEIRRRWYTPYGADRTAVVWPTDRGFLGKQTNPSTKLIDVGAREYDPQLGVFISPDPLVKPADPHTLNPYLYAAHSPVTLTDPSGLSWSASCESGGGGAGANCGAYTQAQHNYKRGGAPKPPAKAKKPACNWFCQTKKGGKAWAGMWWGAAGDIAEGTVDAVVDRYQDAYNTYQEDGIGGLAWWTAKNVACAICTGYNVLSDTIGAAGHSFGAAYKAAKNGDWQEAGKNAIVGAVAVASLVAPVIKVRVAPRVSSCAHTCGGGSASPVAGQKLANQLRLESANSMFTPRGGLANQAITESRLIIRGNDLANQELRAHLTRDGSDIADWGKYTTRTHHSPSGDFQVHFYHNRTTGKVAYDYDYKVVMNAR